MSILRLLHHNPEPNADNSQNRMSAYKKRSHTDTHTHTAKLAEGRNK